MFRFLTAIKDRIMNRGGRAIGELENALPCVRYPVKSYRACVDAGKLWRGSRPSTADLEDLKRGGFRTVIDLRYEATGADCARVEDVGLEYIRIPVTDNTCPTQLQIAFFLNMCESAPEPVYVHCEAGIGRTSVFCAAYRMFINDWNSEAALNEAHAFGLSLPCQIAFIKTMQQPLFR